MISTPSDSKSAPEPDSVGPRGDSRSISQPGEKLRSAALSLREDGAIGDRFASADLELAVVLEQHIPEELRTLFLHVKASVRNRRGERHDLAAKLAQIAEQIDPDEDRSNAPAPTAQV